MEDNKKNNVETAAIETVETKGKGLTIGKICAYTAGAILVVGAVVGGILFFKNNGAEVAEAAADAAETVTE